MQIWRAAVKLKVENGELSVARELLGQAHTVADTHRVRLVLLMGCFYTSCSLFILTLHLIDLDECRYLQVPTRSNSHVTRDALAALPKLSKPCMIQELNPPRPRCLPSAQATCVGDEGVVKGCGVVEFCEPSSSGRMGGMLGRERRWLRRDWG